MLWYSEVRCRGTSNEQHNICFHGEISKMSGPSYSKHHKLNKLINGQNINCSSKYNTKFTGIFTKKM